MQQSVFNDQTLTDEEAGFIFDTAIYEFKRKIYNLRATFTCAIILLALTDIKTLFLGFQ